MEGIAVSAFAKKIKRHNHDIKRIIQQIKVLISGFQQRRVHNTLIKAAPAWQISFPGFLSFGVVDPKIFINGVHVQPDRAEPWSGA